MLLNIGLSDYTVVYHMYSDKCYLITRIPKHISEYYLSTNALSDNMLLDNTMLIYNRRFPDFS
jgi:hypothetical protein